MQHRSWHNAQNLLRVVAGCIYAIWNTDDNVTEFEFNISFKGRTRSPCVRTIAYGRLSVGFSTRSCWTTYFVWEILRLKNNIRVCIYAILYDRLEWCSLRRRRKRRCGRSVFISELRFENLEVLRKVLRKNASGKSGRTHIFHSRAQVLRESQSDIRFANCTGWRKSFKRESTHSGNCH